MSSSKKSAAWEPKISFGSLPLSGGTSGAFADSNRHRIGMAKSHGSSKTLQPLKNARLGGKAPAEPFFQDVQGIL